MTWITPHGGKGKAILHRIDAAKRMTEHPSRLHGIEFDENHIEAYRKPGGLRRLARPAPGHLYKLRPFLAISIRETVRQIDVALPPVVCRQAAEIPEPHLQ
jgi:hypothetical protein